MRKNTLFQRIILSYRFIRYGKGKCRIMTCAKCGSMLITPISEHPGESFSINKNRHIDLIWGEVVQCMKCGAVCYEVQNWNFEGDPTKIDSGFIVKKKES